MAEMESRAEMMARPFEPIAGSAYEFQNVHSLCYIAYYLGEIDGKMERIAKALESVQAGATYRAAFGADARSR